MLDPPPGSMTIKKKIETKYKLPNLNWTSLKPGQVRGTIFSELDDEKYFKVRFFLFSLSLSLSLSRMIHFFLSFSFFS
jgi:hypothetical protein